MNSWNNFDINYVFDDEYEIKLKLFSYHDDIEPIHAESFSTSDKSGLNFHPYAFYFRCKKEEVESRKSLINLILLSFRIYKRADCSSRYILCLTDTDFSWKFDESWKIADANSKSSKDLNELDIQDIINGYKRIKLLNTVSNRTKHAIQFLFLGYTSHYWMQAFVLFMTSLEALLSPPIEDQITTKIIKRTRGLINDTNLCSKRIMNQLYELRSDIIHGRILVGLSFKDHIYEMSKLQIIVLRAFEIILEKDFISIYQNEESKELFFQQLEKNHTEV